MSWKNIIVGQASMPVYQASPKGEPKGHVIVYQEIYGVTEQIRRVCDRLADEGYVGLAPDIFYRLGERFEAAYSDSSEGMRRLKDLTDKLFIEDFKATVDYVRQGSAGSSGAAPIITMGFCAGGRLSFLASTLANEGAAIQGAICFYGGGIAQKYLGVVDQIKCPILLAYGEKDAHIPMTDVEAVRRTLQSHNVSHQIIVYPGAGHAFFNEDRPSYEPKAAKDAWENVKHFLEKACK